MENVVRAKRFELVDDHGRTRALLDTGKNEHVALSFYDSSGKERATVGIMPDGFANISLQGEEGQELVKATAGTDGSDSVFVIKDDNVRHKRR